MSHHESSVLSILDYAPSGMCLIDHDFNIVYWNSCLEHWTSLSRQELVGNDLRECFEHLNEPKYVSRVEEVLYGGPPAVFSSQLHGHFFPSNYHDGSLRVQNTIVTRFEHPDKQGKFALINIQDVTELTKNVEAFREMKDLAFERLKEVEKITALKSRFLAVMSHELRTPLHGIIGSLQLTKDTKLSEEQGEMIAIAHSSAKHMLTLVSDLLDFSKMEEGKLSIRPVPFSLEEEVTQALAPLCVIAQDKGVHFEITVDEELPEVISIDGLRVNQILLNFVSNAIKFTDANGTVRIHLDKGFDEGKGERLICSVTDTGIGMSQEGMKHIFKPFEQAEEDTTHRFGGTGLGLSIVAKLVELMDGEVVVESSPGAGSTFTVQFPLQHVTEGELEEVEEQTEALSQLEDTPSAHILLAEDNRLNQKVAMKLLDNAGHTVVVVNNGKEAVEAYNTESFDLVLMDCHMPIMDGYEATEQIRARETPTRRVPIIAFTANSSEEDTLACIEAGMDGCIQKPFERQELLLAVSRMALHRER